MFFFDIFEDVCGFVGRLGLWMGCELGLWKFGVSGNGYCFVVRVRV